MCNLSGSSTVLFTDTYFVDSSNKQNVSQKVFHFKLLFYKQILLKYFPLLNLKRKLFSNNLSTIFLPGKHLRYGNPHPISWALYRTSRCKMYFISWTCIPRENKVSVYCTFNRHINSFLSVVEHYGISFLLNIYENRLSY